MSQQSDSNKPIEVQADDEGSAKKRLIEAARKLYAENGLEGTSTRDIAKAAGLNISLISYYFGGKEGLYKSVLAHFAAQSQERFAELFDGQDLDNLSREGFLSIMHNMIKGMVPMKFANRDISMMMEREMMTGLPYAKDIYENVVSKILERIVGFYEQGQKRGFVRPDVDPSVIFLSMIHAVDMYSHLSNCPVATQKKVLQISMDEYTEQIFKIFVEGVLV